MWLNSWWKYKTQNFGNNILRNFLSIFKLGVYAHSMLYFALVCNIWVHFSEIFVPWAIKSKEVEIRNQTIKALWWHHITLADNFRYFTRLLRMFYFFEFLGMIWFSWTILSNINDYVTMCAFNHIVIKGMCLNYRTSVHGIMVLMVWIVVLTKDVATVGKRMN